MFGGSVLFRLLGSHPSGRVAVPVSMRDMERLRRTARSLYQRPTRAAIKTGLGFQRHCAHDASAKIQTTEPARTQVPNDDTRDIACIALKRIGPSARPRPRQRDSRGMALTDASACATRRLPRAVRAPVRPPRCRVRCAPVRAAASTDAPRPGPAPGRSSAPDGWSTPR